MSQQYLTDVMSRVSSEALIFMLIILVLAIIRAFSKKQPVPQSKPKKCPLCGKEVQS